MTYIEIKTSGDFGTTYTKSIFFTEEDRDTSTIVKNFCDINGLENLDCLPYNMTNDTVEAFEKYLKKEGFKQIKTKQIYIGD